jgi:phosphatidylserine decarboxylase
MMNTTAKENSLDLREGIAPDEDGRFLCFLYERALGRCFLKMLSSRSVSKACGKFLDSKMSKPMINRFIKKNDIDTDDYEIEDPRCFNEFFVRQIKQELRPFEDDPNVLISPCDALLSAYHIELGTVIPAKQSKYSLRELLADDELAKKYDGGACLVFRLTVSHYHRYVYAVDGVKGDNIFIEGKLHTVRPIALEAEPVFVQNCREYTVIETERFGDVVQMEVGAMLVGKIDNYHGARSVTRGEEKGKFLYA